MNQYDTCQMVPCLLGIDRMWWIYLWIIFMEELLYGCNFPRRVNICQEAKHKVLWTVVITACCAITLAPEGAVWSRYTFLRYNGQLLYVLLHNGFCLPPQSWCFTIPLAGSGAWLVAHRAEQRKQFKALLCAKPRTFEEIRQERRRAEKNGTAIILPPTMSLEETEEEVAPTKVLDGFFLVCWYLRLRFKESLLGF